jgi:hypothetical protein
MTKSIDVPLVRAAARLAGDRRFMASALAITNGGKLEEAISATRLQCSIDAVVDLALCFRPSGKSEGFKTDVQRIAEFVGVPAGQVAALIREAEAIEVLRGHQPTEFLAAARDKLQDEQKKDEDENK